VTIEKVNIEQKFNLFQDYWNPKIVGELNNSYVKLVKVKGEFIWHHHETEDELFLIIKGRLLVKFQERNIWLEAGEFLIIPRGVEHLPIAEDEVHMLVFEPKSVLNTGNVQSEQTVPDLQHI
jgi:mannose-6-phosphate isomerase-like protein (cupin superfamily)